MFIKHLLGAVGEYKQIDTNRKPWLQMAYSLLLGEMQETVTGGETSYY